MSKTGLPQRPEEHAIGCKAEAIIHYQLDADSWVFRQVTGVDYGVDFVLELAENGELTGKSLLCQAKGTSVLEKNLIASETTASYPIPTKTINYGLQASVPMVVFLVDIENEDVYFASVTDEFPDEKALTTKTKHMHFDMRRTLKENGSVLVDMAKR